MAITERQKQLVQSSFAKVEPISEQAADIFYKTLFEYDPSLKPLFKTSIKAQGQKLMATLKLAVAGLDDLEKLVPVLQSLAERHVGYGVEAKDFTPVGNALLHTLKVGLGDEWDSELRQAWVDTIHLVADVMKAHSFNES
ncbi:MULTISPECIES: globin family protein [Pseudoalteromonas]|uniref:Hemin receptor n=1 Tax=Pseudoalteromonas amylolytica TaxID=1859457 RepID=A0A1S1MP88_9GAMM|nr:MULTISPECIES: globin family protein [Pseudoalteromonas]MCF6437374.1 globin domain-containing protein [Pseudoalteromonas sp. MMG022]OHU86858.1 hemin receptor [Pseudoalteromonas amylolytica]OHU89483.1 hemin receptor [Pseudoalteromonas sp. JW3]